MKSRITTTFVLATALSLVTCGSAFSQQEDSSDDTPVLDAGTLMPDSWEIDPFELTDQDGQVMNLDRLRANWTFVYLGYTFCPDVCPTTLATLGAIDNRLSEDGLDTNVQYLFVSVDPNRDTPERLKEYVRYFGDDFIGATGDPESLEDFANSIGQVFHVPEDPPDKNYLVDHSSILALFDPDANLYAIFRSPHVTDAIESSFRNILKFFND